ncbi:MAG: hypothetical protein ABI690_20405 [Chloroflexota bacterium]
MESYPPNYPDILSYVTNGQQMLVSVIQAALSVRPETVPAGRPFEAIIMLQNTTDVNVEVTASLQLPAADAARVKGRFVAQPDHQVVTLLPAEVGYLVMPIYVYPDTAPANHYKLGVDLRAIPMAQPRRIRQIKVNGVTNEINLEYYFYLTDETIDSLMELRELEFSAGSKGVLAGASALLGKTRFLGKTGMLGSGLETSFNVGAAQMGKLTHSKTGWISLWAMGDSSDARPLFERHRDTLTDEILPLLTAESLFRPFYSATQTYLKKQSYVVQSLEIMFMTKLLTSVVAAAANPPKVYDYPGQELYHVGGLGQRGHAHDGSPIPLPFWSRTLLGLIGVDPQVMTNPAATLAGPLYEDVLRDAITHGINMLHAVTGLELGTRDEAYVYTEYLIDLIKQPNRPLTFSDVYLPLVIGGILVTNDVVMKEEEPLFSFQKMHETLLARQPEHTDENDLVFQMTEQCLAWALRRYRDWF